MARIRTVKPKLFTHEGLYDAEHETGLPLRLSFIGLFTEADRDGRFQWRPRTLKAAILPFDDVDFSRVLDALATRGFLVKYSSRAGEKLGVIPTFRLHQAINNKEPPSTLDAPSDEDLARALSLASQANANASVTRQSRVNNALPQSLRKSRGEGKGREGKGKEGKTTKPSLDETKTVIPAHAREVAPTSSSSSSSEVVAIETAMREAHARGIPDAKRRIVEAAIAGATSEQIADCLATAAQQKPDGFTANYALGIVLNRIEEGFYANGRAHAAPTIAPPRTAYQAARMADLDVAEQMRAIRERREAEDARERLANDEHTIDMPTDDEARHDR